MCLGARVGQRGGGTSLVSRFVNTGEGEAFKQILNTDSQTRL